MAEGGVGVGGGVRVGEDVEEERWIEAESQKAAGSGEGEEASDSDPEICELFADPDPLETFDFNWNVSDQDIHIKLTGHKTELGQTLHSTGLTLWRASKLLCDYLVANTEAVQGKRVLELGAGLGLCGILAHHLSAQEVVLTDGDTDALANLRSNVRANCPTTCALTDIALTDADSPAAVCCRQLVWGSKVTAFVERHGQFDTILGSDIIYLEEVLEPIWNTISQVMKNDGRFLLAYARRNVSVDLVLAEATKRNFCWECPPTTEGVFVFRKK